MVTRFSSVGVLKTLILVISLITCVLANDVMAQTGHIQSADKSPMIIKYHFSIPGDDHHGYNAELIQRVLEITRPEFGDYRIQTYSQAPIGKRQAVLLNEGKLLNMQWSSPGTDIASADVIEIPIDILRGLQGYRVCMINAGTDIDFSKITDIESFKKLRIAQGSAWGELPIYYYNGITPLEPPTLGGLYPMLGFKRFDCVPLGVNEIGTILDIEKPHYPFLAIEKTLLIYYNFPIYFYVSKKYPDIAKRFELGLKKMIASGEFNSLFNKYHQKKLMQLNLKQRRLICLNSPFTADAHQCQKAIEQLKQL